MELLKRMTIRLRAESKLVGKPYRLEMIKTAHIFVKSLEI